MEKIEKKSFKKNKQKYKTAAKNLKLVTISAQKMEEMKIVSSNDLGVFYKYVNRHSVHKTGIGPLKTATGTLILEDAEKAELLNSYFVSVCTKDNGTFPALQDLAADGNKLIDVAFRIQQI